MKRKTLTYISLLLYLTLSASVYAEIIEQKKLNFKFDSESLMKGNIKFSHRLLSAQRIKEKFTKVAELDSIGVLKNKHDMFSITKVVYVINKPIGFFDHKQMIDKDFLKYTGKNKKFKDVTEGVFKIDQEGNNHILKIYFDSDDVSTLPGARAVKAATALKKLDVISKSASAIVLKEYSNFKHTQHGSVSITSFVPLKENKTLSISYHLTAYRKGVTPKHPTSFIENLKEEKKALESFKD